MNIMVVSDTHGSLANLMIALEKEKEIEIDMLLHLGDLCLEEEVLKNLVNCQVHVVAGNCDRYIDTKEKIIEIDGKKAFMTHGHKYYIDADRLDLAAETEKRGAYIGFYGHTHIPMIEYIGKCVIVNPGSISRPRQTGFRPSYIMMDTNNGGEPIFEIKYL